MAEVADIHEPGLLFVTNELKPTQSELEYHDCYNHEHGPMRLQLDFILNLHRYKSREKEGPRWLNCCDLDPISGLAGSAYKDQTKQRTQREARIVDDGMDFDRRVYKLYSSTGTAKSPAPVVMAVHMVVDDKDQDEVDRWYQEEHTEALTKVPGWRRSRRYRLVRSDDKKAGEVENLALHEFDEVNGLGGPQLVAARDTPWHEKVSKLLKSRKKATYDLVHVMKAENHRPPAESHAVAAVARMKDGLEIEYRIDGNSDKDAPLIVLSNSLLTNLYLWDGTINQLAAASPKFRYLRYNLRGYSSGSPTPVNVDVLADDIAAILDHIGVQKCYAVVGVSVGGATALNFAIKYPERLEKFVACACNVASSEENTAVWQERVALSKKQDGWYEFADQTVKRWFVPQSIKEDIPAVSDVLGMINMASRDGFADSVQALCNFDLSGQLGNVSTPGLFVVGYSDGLLPLVMRAISQKTPNTAIKEVSRSGHLPMVENPTGFFEAISEFLSPS